jgi:hypothetical protein
MRCVIVYEGQSSFFGLIIRIECFNYIRSIRFKVVGMYTILGLQKNAVCIYGFTNLKSKVTIEKTSTCPLDCDKTYVHVHLSVTMEASED